jgi:hypothetical protein
MAHQEKETSGLEWRITLGDGSSKSLVPETGPISRIWMGLKGLMAGLVLKVLKFLNKAWDIGVDDPRKVIHCLKAGMALTIVSLVYFTRPLYEGVGGNAMWAVMTVVVVFENTVGKYSKFVETLNNQCPKLCKMSSSIVTGPPHYLRIKHHRKTSNQVFFFNEFCNVL